MRCTLNIPGSGSRAICRLLASFYQTASARTEHRIPITKSALSTHLSSGSVSAALELCLLVAAFPHLLGPDPHLRRHHSPLLELDSMPHPLLLHCHSYLFKALGRGHLCAYLSEVKGCKIKSRSVKDRCVGFTQNLVNQKLNLCSTKPSKGF